MNASTYEEDVLKRYNLTSAVKITHNQYHDGVQVVLEDGKRLWFSPFLQMSEEMGIKPKIRVTFPDAPNSPGGFGTPKKVDA